MRLYQIASAATTRFAYDGTDAIAEYRYALEAPMSEITKQDIVEAIDDVLGGRRVLKWDYLVSTTFDDRLVSSWTDRMRDLEEQYSGRSEGRMLSDEGIERLRQLKKDLLGSSE